MKAKQSSSDQMPNLTALPSTMRHVHSQFTKQWQALRNGPPLWQRRECIPFTLSAFGLCILTYLILGGGRPLGRPGTGYDREGAESIDPSVTGLEALTFKPCDSSYSEYTPCEDHERGLKYPRDMMQYRERHCPMENEKLRCLIPPPKDYSWPVPWPQSRELVWFANVPHKHLATYKANQNWVTLQDDKLYFPGGGTSFPNGAQQYIKDLEKIIDLSSGRVRTALDTGCGVASFGAYMLDRNVMTMSFAPRDVNHDAQLQFALERGLPAILGIFGSKRQPYPAWAFDLIHCSRCLIPWTKNDALYMIELDRLLRPGGYWVFSGPPINWEELADGWGRTREDLKAEQDEIEMKAASLCWAKVAQKGSIAVWQKPLDSVACMLGRQEGAQPPLCPDTPPSYDTAWYTPLQACVTLGPPREISEEGKAQMLPRWPGRVWAMPPRAPADSGERFTLDNQRWQRRLAHYKSEVVPDLATTRFRNVMDMNARLGGFGAALAEDAVWVMNVVPVEATLSDTLGIIFERGLIGTYHNWCEAFSTYPRSYDFIHADGVLGLYLERCNLLDVLLEVDRMLRPEGTFLARDTHSLVLAALKVTPGLRWECHKTETEKGKKGTRERLLVCKKELWTL